MPNAAHQANIVSAGLAVLIQAGASPLLEESSHLKMREFENELGLLVKSLTRS